MTSISNISAGAKLHDAASEPTSTIIERHKIERVRYDLKRRVLTVRKVTRLTPHMIRVTLTGEELGEFQSLGPDDHVKLVIPEPGELPRFPQMGADGRMVIDPGHKPVLRDYTPRRFDRDRRELDIDFAVHDAGPATEWAMQAKPGDLLGVGGPRGSQVVTDDFDWYLLVGDDTALPAIGRRVEAMRAGAKAIVVGEVAGPDDEQRFESAADIRYRWLHRGDEASGESDALDTVLRMLDLPEGDGYVWIACETSLSKRLRKIMTEERNHPKAWIKAAGYWKRGQADFHETHGD